MTFATSSSAAVGEDGLSVRHARDAGSALDAGGLEVRGLDPDEGPALGDQLRADAPPDGRRKREDPMEEHPQHEGHEDAARDGPVDAKREVAGVASRHPGRVTRWRPPGRSRPRSCRLRRRARPPRGAAPGCDTRSSEAGRCPGRDRGRTTGSAASGRSPSPRRRGAPRSGARPPRRRSDRPRATAARRERRFRPAGRSASRTLRGSPPSRPSSGTPGGARGRACREGRRSGLAVNSRSESQRRRHWSPTRAFASRITNGTPRRAR